MTTIVSPYPPRWYDEARATPGARWWRLRLLPNEDGHLMVMRTDATEATECRMDGGATWVSWEFFDGETGFIDAGLDCPKVDRVWLGYQFLGHQFLDILSVEVPTGCPRWRPLTAPGDYAHPDGEGVCCTPSRYERLRL